MSIVPRPKRRGLEDCPTCSGTRYCAPMRCYCGHRDCPAFASYVDLADLPTPTVPAPRKTASTSWDDRTEATWIDQL